MERNKKLRVAIIIPPLVEHLNRGTGNYTNNLVESLRRIENIETSLLPYNTETNNYDIVHYPYFDPFFLTLPLRKKKPTVVTVHDLIPIRMEKNFRPGFRGKIKWQIQKISLQMVQQVITDSIFSRKDIIQFTKIKKNNIHVIPLGIGKEFYSIPTQQQQFKIKKSLRLPNKYLLYVGDVNVNKNIPTLLRIFVEIKKELQNIKLVCVGSGFVKPSKELTSIMHISSALHIDSDISRYSSLSVDEINSIYHSASVCVLPSLYEGFGLPVLEAMAAGVPVVISRAESLLEIAKGAAISEDASDLGAMKKALLGILRDEMLRKKYINLGRERAKEFSWNKCAKATVDVYKKAYRENK